MSLKPKWTSEDSAASVKEGWDIFECHGSSSGPWQLQRIDCPEDGSEPVFKADQDAWVHVVDKASTRGGYLHRKALGFLNIKNLPEFKRIKDYTDAINSDVPLPIGRVALPQEKVSVLIEMDSRGWPERKYMCWCSNCSQMFTGHKRQVRCRVCEETVQALKEESSKHRKALEWIANWGHDPSREEGACELAQGMRYVAARAIGLVEDTRGA